MHRHASLVALLCAASLVGCGEKKNPVEPVLGPQPTAEVKFFNFSVGSPNVNFYADSVKMTAINSATGAESNLGTAYGAAGNAGLYNNIVVGQHTFSARITATTDHGLVISNAAQSVDAGKKYSYYQSGVYNSTAKTADSFVIADDWTAPTDTLAHVRFVNAISNAPNPIQLVIKSQATGSTEIALGVATGYKSATTFTAIPGGVYDLYGRYPGSSTNVFTKTGISFLGRRVYTVTARGDVTATTTANKPTFDNTANY